MSALKEAFDKAGFVSVDGRLYDIALKAMVKHADDNEAAIEAIWRCVAKEQELLVQLFERERIPTIRALLYRVRNNLYRKQQNQTPLEKKATNVVNMLREKERVAERARLADERRQQQEENKKYNEYLRQWRATPIGNLEIGGGPVWELTPGTVRTWLVSQTRKWNTVRLLIDGLPDNDRPIEYYRKPSEVAALWKQAATL